MIFSNQLRIKYTFYSFVPASTDLRKSNRMLSSLGDRISITYAFFNKWQYCLYRTKHGEIVPPFTEQWDNLVYQARSINCEEMPNSLKENKFVAILFLLLFPYRGTPSVINSIAYCFDKTWFIDQPIE